jgi:hypothetical protein
MTSEGVKPVPIWPFDVLAVSLFVLILTAGIGCMGHKAAHDIVIEFVVPDAFRGVVVMEKSPSAPAPVVTKREGQTIYTYTVSADGRLFVPDFSPMEAWHSGRARYYSGKKLPVRGVDSAADDDVALDQVAAEYIVIGTRRDIKEFWRRTSSGPPITPGPL